jgi:hypothetical protein
MERRPVLKWVAGLIGMSVLTTVGGLAWFTVFAGSAFALYVVIAVP